MKTDVLYEVTDMREDGPLSGIHFLQTMSGGLLVGDAQGLRIAPLAFDDDDPEAFKDDEINGTVRVDTPEGTVLFQVLTLALWSQIGGSFTVGAPSFKTEGELYKYLGATF